MKTLILLLTSLLTFTNVSDAKVFTQQQLLGDPLAMTITQAIAMPKVDSAERGSILALPNRASTFLFEDRGDLRYRYQLQRSKAAPLVFVLPGAGAVASSSGALFLSEKLYAQGYHTVVLDNPFSWTFAVAASRSALPGYLPDDARDLYAAMKLVIADLKAQGLVHPSSYSLMGYSLGALDSLFIKRIDDQVGAFRFDRVVLQNPPMDLMHAFRAIDRFSLEAATMSQDRRDGVMGRVLAIAEKFLTKNGGSDFSNPNVLVNAFNELNFTERDMKFLISKTFRDGLRDVIFASQQVRDLGVLKVPASRYERNGRYDEAASIDFEGYVARFLLPKLKKRFGAGYSLDDLNRESSLYQFADMIKNDPRIVAVHSKDDFILKAGDMDWLNTHFGARFVGFPVGGHCGSINFPQFSLALKKAFLSR